MYGAYKVFLQTIFSNPFLLFLNMYILYKICSLQTANMHFLLLEKSVSYFLAFHCKFLNFKYFFLLIRSSET